MKPTTIVYISGTMKYETTSSGTLHCQPYIDGKRVHVSFSTESAAQSFVLAFEACTARDPTRRRELVSQAKADFAESKRRKREARRLMNPSQQVKRIKAIETHGDNYAVEMRAMIYTKEFLENEFECKLLPDGCLADIAVRVKEDEESEYFGVQVKSCSNRCNDGAARFEAVNHYSGLPVMCVCLNEGSKAKPEIYCIPGEKLKDLKSCLAIGQKSAKYDSFKVKNEQTLALVLKDMIRKEKYEARSLEQLSKPVSIDHFLEHFAHNCWKQQNPQFEVRDRDWRDLENGVFDHQEVLGDKRRIQEKVSRLNGVSFHVNLRKRGGNHCGAIPYERNDWDLLRVFLMGLRKDDGTYDLERPPKDSGQYTEEYVQELTLLGYWDFPAETLALKGYFNLGSSTSLTCCLPDEQEEFFGLKRKNKIQDEVKWIQEHFFLVCKCNAQHACFPSGQDNMNP